MTKLHRASLLGMTIQFVILLFWLLALTSCSTPDAYQQTIQNWYGQSAEALTARWGTPNQKIILADGKSYYVYTTQTTPYFPSPTLTNTVFVAKKSGKTFAAAVPAQEQLSMPLCVTTFLVSPQQRVMKAWYKGGGCMRTLVMPVQAGIQ